MVTNRLISSAKGFGLIELCVIIVTIGIVTGIILQSMTGVVQDAKQLETERELEMLGRAIVGDASIVQDGVRADFGYFGDVGAFPITLQSLYTNPGSLPTWSGPYVSPRFSQDTVSYQLDAWGRPYTYSGGLSITSIGSGANIVKKIADDAADYLYNNVSGEVRDIVDSLPGSVEKDSVKVLVTFPRGTSGFVTRNKTPLADGSFVMDSVPAGKHLWQFIYTPASDTVKRYVTVLPRHKSNTEVLVKFSSPYFTPCGDSVILRPSSAGSLTGLTNSGGTNWGCVDEATSDGDATRVIRASSSYASDEYNLPNPTAPSCVIQSVTVYCVARKANTTGNVRPSLYISSTEYNGTAQPLTTSYATYSHTWTTNPNSSSAWTWTNINSLQVGVRLQGESGTYPAYCTQVWAVVKLQP